MFKATGPSWKRESTTMESSFRIQSECVLGTKPILVISVKQVQEDLERRQQAEPSEEARSKLTLVSELQAVFRELYPPTTRPSRPGYVPTRSRSEDDRPNLIALDWSGVFDSSIVTCDKVHRGLPCLYLYVHGKSDQHHYVKQPLVHACQGIYEGVLDGCKPKHGTDRKWTSDSAGKRVLALNIKGETGKDKGRSPEQQEQDLKDSLYIAGNHLCNKCPCTKAGLVDRSRLVRFRAEDGKDYLRCECPRRHVDVPLFEVKRKVDMTEAAAATEPGEDSAEHPVQSKRPRMGGRKKSQSPSFSTGVDGARTEESASWSGARHESSRLPLPSPKEGQISLEGGARSVSFLDLLGMAADKSQPLPVHPQSDQPAFTKQSNALFDILNREKAQFIQQVLDKQAEPERPKLMENPLYRESGLSVHAKPGAHQLTAMQGGAMDPTQHVIQPFIRVSPRGGFAPMDATRFLAAGGASPLAFPHILPSLTTREAAPAEGGANRLQGIQSLQQAIGAPMSAQQQQDPR